jgi:hypothetical protein
MYVRSIPTRGIPPRGSVQDRIACEMLAREQRRAVHGNVYLGRLLSLNMSIPPKLFDLWTTLYMMEVTHESYSPAAVKDKEQALKEIADREGQTQQQRVSLFSKLDALTATDEGMRPASPEEMEAVKRKLRRRHLQVRTEDGTRVPLEAVRAQATTPKKKR